MGVCMYTEMQQDVFPEIFLQILCVLFPALCFQQFSTNTQRYIIVCSFHVKCIKQMLKNLFNWRAKCSSKLPISQSVLVLLTPLRMYSGGLYSKGGPAEPHHIVRNRN
jgi:hypothetical protein